MNVFVGADDAAEVFASLPSGVTYTDADVAEATERDQARLWWDTTPVDLQLAADRLHTVLGDDPRVARLRDLDVR